MRRHSNLFLGLLCLVLAAIPFQGNAQFSGSGSGTENDPYLIFNPIQLNEVRNFLNDESVYFKLMSDIDLTDWLADNNPTQGWQPIGTSSSPFKGNFKGQGHKVSGLFINRSTTDYVGFFGNASSARIESLDIEGSEVKGKNYTGGLAGYTTTCYLSTNHVNLKVTGGNYVGGYVGRDNSNSQFRNSSYTGQVSGAGSVGGLMGYASSSTILNCSSNANVAATANASSAGIGYANGVTITNLQTVGNITGKQNVGGIIGAVVGTSNTSVSNCSSEGNKDGTQAVAGLVGRTLAPLTINESHSIGDIFSSENCAGGLVGQSKSTLQVSNCYSVANVNTTASKAGGLVGNCAVFNIDNCYAIGDVSAIDYAGGLVGLCDTATIESGSAKLLYSYRSYTGDEGYYDKRIFSVGDMVYANEYNEAFSTQQSSSYPIAYYIFSVEIANSNNYEFKYNNHYYWGNSSRHYKYRYKVIVITTTLTNSYYNGNVVAGNDYAGGLIGDIYASGLISQNYAYGTVKGKNNVGGLVGHGQGLDSNENKAILASNAAIVETVNATQSNVGRVYGSVGSNVTVGACGTDAENKGLATAKVTLNGLQQNLPDNLKHGTNVGNATLKLRATYQGIQWDFTNWKILETECYPYKEGQCAPPVFTGALTSGATVISGKSVNGGTVYLTVGDKNYTAATNANTWSVTVDQLHAGDVVKAYAVNDSLGQSYISKQVVQFKGKGTEAEPYEIYTANDLSKSTSYSYYKLMNDIDLTEWINSNSRTTGWIPIGLDGGGSMKQLDGDGHRVTGLWSNTTIDFCGLIANTQNATICNIKVYTAEGKKVKGGSNSGVIVGKAVNTTFSNVTVNGSVQGASYVGGLAGYSSNCHFANCKMSGSVVGAGNYVGGICSGYNNGNTLELCSSTASVTGVDYVGGLIGISNSTINKSHAAASVTGNNYVGGISGNSSGSITECYSDGTVTANNNTACYAGGVAGVNNGLIADCYSSADVNSGVVDGSVATSDLQQFAGGISGYSYGTIERCFASGNIYAVKFGAGVVGYNDGTAAVTRQCYAINDRIDVSNETGIALRVIGGIKNSAPAPGTDNYALKTMVVSINNVTQVIYDDLLHGISKTLDVMKQRDTYSDNGWDMTNIWDIDEGDGFPYLRVSEQTNTPIATEIALEQNVTIYKGDSHVIQVSILPNTASTVFSWQSSNANVVAVNSQGVVTGVEAGEAVIMATTTDGSNLTAQCTVTVLEHAVPATEIILDRDVLTMTVGQLVTLTATVLPENADNQEVVWNSTDATVASVTSNGEVRALQTGNTQIYATTTDGSNLSAVCEVTVVDASGNMLVSSDLTAGNGSEVDWIIGLNNEASITAIQADIFLPEGITIAMEDEDYLIDLTDRKARDHTVSASPLPDGGIRVLIGSATSKPFSGNEGDLFIVRLVVADDVSGGDYNLDIRNVIMSATDATVYYSPDVTTKLTVIDYLRGDANGDRAVNVGDYVTVGNYILNLNPQPFVFKAADVDGNQTINVGDMVGIANIILGIQNAPVLRASAEISSTLALGVTCNRIDNERYAVVLDLANEVDLTAMQLDVELPAGMSVEDAFLSERASANHQIAVAKLENGDYRLLTASNTNSTFSGQEGTLVTMIVKGNGNGVMTLNNIIIAEPNTVCHSQDDIQIQLDAIPTAIDDISASVRIYLEGKNVIVESPCDNIMQVILPNGINTMRQVKAGRNVFRNIGQGIIFIKVANKVAKFRL